MRNENKQTIEDLKTMQSWDLNRKIMVTQTRITEWYQKNNGAVYVSFSGGKDSTVLLDIARKLYPDIPVVFVDTGLEFPELREFVKSVDDVTTVSPSMSFRKVIEQYGYPVISKEVSKRVYEYHNAEQKGNLEDTCAYKEFNGLRMSSNGKSCFNKKKWAFLLQADFKISHKCCDVMKKMPVKLYEKQTGNKPIVATMATESNARMTAWLKHGCNAFDSSRPISQPMSFWTEQDVLQYIIRYNLPIASVYGDIVQNDDGEYTTTGEKRTGCMFCMYGTTFEKCPNRFQRMKTTHPQIFDYCMKPWDKGGLGLAEVLKFINVNFD